MTKFKRYIKNIFSIAGLEWNDGKKPQSHDDGIIVSASNTDTAAQRSQIASRQYMMSIKNFAINLVAPLVDILYSTDIDGEVVSTNRVGNLPENTPVKFLRGRTYNNITDLEFFILPPLIVVGSGNLFNQLNDIVEVGSLYNLVITAIHRTGIIRNGDGLAQVILQGDVVPIASFIFTDPDDTITAYDASINLQEHIAEWTVEFNDNNTTCDITWEEGVAPYYDQAQNRRYEFDGALRAAGSELITHEVHGAYALFFGSGAAGSAPTDSAGVRALIRTLIDTRTSSVFQDTGRFFNGVQEFYFYVPNGIEFELFQRVQTAAWLTTGFTTSPITVNDAGGNPLDYVKYVLEVGGVGYLEDFDYAYDTRGNYIPL